MNKMEDYGLFEPKIHDFGDSYHMTDAERFGGASDAVKKLRRKYRHYSDYVMAFGIFMDYLKELVQKYGGKRQFLFNYKLGLVTEYIPPVPTFRETEENLLQKEAGYVVVKHGEPDYSLPEEDEERIRNASSDSGIGLMIEENERRYSPFGDVGRTFKTELMENDKILEELEILQRYSEDNQLYDPFDQSKGRRKGKKKKSKRNVAKEIKRRKKLLRKAAEGLSIKEAIKRWNRLEDGLITEEDDEENAYVIYKGMTIRKTEFEAIQLQEAFVESGFMPKGSMRGIKSKRLRRMIKKNSKSAKKKAKKNKKNYWEADEDGNVDMDAFLDDYNASGEFGMSFKAFEKEMCAFNRDSMKREMEDY